MDSLNHDYSKLENKLFDSLDNNSEISKIKDEAKKIYDRGSLTDEQQTVLLNIITLTNDILISREAEGGGLEELQKASRIVTEVKNPNTLNKNFINAMESASKIYHRIGQSQRELFEDLEWYGKLSVNRNDDLVKAFTNKLSEAYEGVHMLCNDSDGNCLYRALSTCDAILQDQIPLQSLQDNITPSEQGAPEKRALAVKHMEENPEYYEGSDWQTHARDGVWGEDSQIRALAAAEDRPILVLQRNRNQLEGTIYAKGAEESINHVDPTKLRVIVNLGNIHYNALYTTLEHRQRLAEQYNIVPVG